MHVADWGLGRFVKSKWGYNVFGVGYGGGEGFQGALRYWEW